MKTTYQEAAEVGELFEHVYATTDKVLDNYNLNPKICDTLLKELSQIKKDLRDLEKEYDILLKNL